MTQRSLKRAFTQSGAPGMNCSHSCEGTSSIAISLTSKGCEAASTSGSFVPETPIVNPSAGGAGSRFGTPRGGSSAPACGGDGNSPGRTRDPARNAAYPIA